MISLFRYLFILALVLWIGSIVFFSFLASPSIFKVLPREQAGEVVGAIFPKYHLLGYVACAVALGALFGLRQAGAAQAIGGAMLLLALMGGLQLTMGLVVGPMVAQARDAVKTAPQGPDTERLQKNFRALHGVSMVLNLTVLTLGLVLLYLVASRLQL